MGNIFHEILARIRKSSQCIGLFVGLFIGSYYLLASEKSGPIDSLAGIRDRDMLSLPDLFMLAQHYYDADSLQKCLDYLSYMKAQNKISSHIEVRLKSGILEGFALLNSGNPSKAFTAMFDSYQQAKLLKRDTLIMRSAAGLGIISRELADYSKAMDYLEEALKVAVRLSLKVDEVKVRNEMGSVYLLSDNPESALKVYRDVREMGLSLNDSQMLSVANGNIASVNLSLKRYPEALRALEENLRDFRQYLGLRNSIITLLNAGEICTRIGRFDQSREYLNEAMTLSRLNAFPALEMESLKRIGYLYERLKDYASALQSYRAYTQLKDSLFSIEKQKQIFEIESKYQLEQDRIVLTVYRQKMRTRNITIFLMILIIAAMVIIYFFHRRNNKLKMRLEEGKKRQMQQEIEARNRELASLALNLGQKGQLLLKLEEFLQELQIMSRSNKVRSLIQEQRGEFLVNNYLDHKWDDFTRHFEQVHPTFFNQIRTKHPDLSSNDLIHCAFIKLLLKQKDVAMILGINERSVQMIRYRLKKKLALSPADDLRGYITGFAFGETAPSIKAL